MFYYFRFQYLFKYFALLHLSHFSLYMFPFFFFKQKTAYEVRFGDWSSDVCSSDLIEFNPANTNDHIERFKALKRDRDAGAVAAALKRLYDDVRSGSNMQPGMIDAFLASASIGETWGTVRLAMGHAYDPYGDRKSVVWGERG